MKNPLLVKSDLSRSRWRSAAVLGFAAAVCIVLKAAGAALAGALAARGVLAAGIPGRPYQALLVATTMVVAWVVLPRLGATRAVYGALLLGLVLGARFV